MQKELKEYSEAVVENLEATKSITNAEMRKKKAHYRLLRASDELRAKTRELLEDSYVMN